MVSLGMLVVIFFASLLLAAWALACAARLVGSARGRVRVGLIAAVITTVSAIPFAGIRALLPATQGTGAAVVTLVLFAVQMVVVFIVLRRAFALSSRRTWVPFSVYIVLLFGQVGLALGVIKPLLMEAFVLPTKSMAPTIEQGDCFLVNKLIRPRRWDLVAYWRHDGQPAVYCKRLVGLPGERIRFEQGDIYVNEQAAAPPPVLADRLYARPSSVPQPTARYRDGETIVLGSDQYFLIGDNVDLSADSRMLGPSEGAALVGVVDVVYWPLGRARVVR